MLRRRLATTTCSVVLGVVVTACGGGGDSDDAATRSGRFAGVHERVCVALAAAADDGDLDEAQAVFDDVHVGLHALATAVGERDRAVAARLLEAKQAVDVMEAEMRSRSGEEPPIV